MRKIDNNTRPPKRTRSGKHLFFPYPSVFAKSYVRCVHGQAYDALFFPHFFKLSCQNIKRPKHLIFLNFLLVELHYFEFTSVLLANITSVNAIGALVKETRSVTMNFFQKKYFLFKSFVKIN